MYATAKQSILLLLTFFLPFCCCQASSHPSWQQVIVLTFSSASISAYRGTTVASTAQDHHAVLYTTPQEIRKITF
jgi:ABC-type sulfate transport system permease component